uniref:Cytochrome P450 4g15 n=1 Tax=Prodiamesa olivacea TaxID=288840 RepID=A0A7T7FQY2_9DIPT|nr:cytochrome P450 4g15 [Prodiamesa olivacea]
MAGTVAADFSQPNTASPTTVFYSLLIPAAILWFFYWRLSRRNLYKLAEKLPGPPGLPIIGNALDLTGSSHIVFKTIITKGKDFNDVIKLWVGPKLLVFLVDPRDIELVLSSQVYLDKSPEYRFFKPWLGNGLLISSGHKWRAHRKLIAPTFHLNVLKSFLELFNDNSRHVCNKMRALNGKTFDCHDYMSECTVEILLETAMGVSRKTQDQSGFDYAMAVMKMCDILHLRHTKVWLYPDWIFNLTKHAKVQVKLLDVIHSLTKKVIKNKKDAFSKGTRGSLATPEFIKPEEKFEKTKDENKKTIVVEGLSFGQSTGLKDDLDVDDTNDIGEKKRLAFLDLLLESAENGAVISEEEIKEQVDTIMFEGHDTTAAGSSFFLSLMGIHQDIQDKVVEELDQIFGDSERPCTFQDTLEMKYLERCMMETLRMYPPVPVIARHMKEDLKLASGDYVIPKGATVVVATYKLHRLESIYPNPEKFDPDNFLPERQANRHYYAFVPFSAGPRSCVGRKYAMLKLKVILSTILRQFRVHSDLKEQDFRLQADIILKREEGFQVRLEPRKPRAKQAAAS